MSLLEPLIATVTEWSEAVEQRCMAEGSPLSPSLQAKAHSAGVSYPEKIRVMFVSKIETPVNVLLETVAQQKGLSLDGIAGITFGYGILILERRAFDEHLMVHECVHVGQYERLGKQAFLRKYISDCLEHGYEDSPLEREAESIADEICP